MTCSAQQLPAARAGSAPHKAEVHAQAAVLTAALQAHEYAIRHRSPLWVFGVAVHAHLQVAPAVGPRSKAEYASLAYHSTVRNTRWVIRTLFSGRACKARKIFKLSPEAIALPIPTHFQAAPLYSKRIQRLPMVKTRCSCLLFATLHAKTFNARAAAPGSAHNFCFGTSCKCKACDCSEYNAILHVSHSAIVTAIMWAASAHEGSCWYSLKFESHAPRVPLLGRLRGSRLLVQANAELSQHRIRRVLCAGRPVSTPKCQRSLCARAASASGSNKAPTLQEVAAIDQLIDLLLVRQTELFVYLLLSHFRAPHATETSCS